MITGKLKEHREGIIESLTQLEQIRKIVANTNIKNSELRKEILKVLEESDDSIVPDLEQISKGKYSNIFIMLAGKYMYFRKFMPAVFGSIKFTTDSKKADPLIRAVYFFNMLNSSGKRKMPKNTPTEFISKSQKSVLNKSSGSIDRRVWECGVYYNLRGELK